MNTRRCSNKSEACYGRAMRVRVTYPGVKARRMRLCDLCRAVYREDGFKVKVISND